MGLIDCMLQKDPGLRLDSQTLEDTIQQMMIKFPRKDDDESMFMKGLVAETPVDDSGETPLLNFSAAPVWVDFADNQFVVSKKEPADWRALVTPVTQSEPLKHEATPLRKNPPTKISTKQVPRININELRSKYKGQPGGGFEVEIFTGLSKEVEEELNKQSEAKGRRK